MVQGDETRIVREEDADTSDPQPGRFRNPGRLWADNSVHDGFSTVPDLREGIVRILLVRPGESTADENQILAGGDRVIADPALTDHGKEQARALGLALRDAVLAKSRAGLLYTSSGNICIGSSVMQRAVETADILTRETFIKNVKQLEPSEKLVEMRFGDLEGKSMPDVAGQIKQTEEAWQKGETDLCVGDTGESPEALEERAFEGIKSLLASDPSARIVLFVGHFWLNQVLLSAWTGLGLDRMREINQPKVGVSVIDIDVDDVRFADVHVIGWQPPSSMLPSNWRSLGWLPSKL